MRIIRIPKKCGKTRLIYVPSPAEMSAYRSIVGQLARKAERICPAEVPHGFVRGRSPVSNAIAHVGHAFTTCFDLQDFFDSIEERHLRGKLSVKEMSRVLVDGAPRQGLPTSPAVANLAASDLDKAILKWGDKNKHQFIYTRYADDLAFSYDRPCLTAVILREIPLIISRVGFNVNDSKTRTMSASSGRRIITGVAVDDGIHPPRRMKRRLRAARHRKNESEASGLAEWCKMKLPRPRSKIKEANGDEITRLVRVWRLPTICLNKLPEKLAEETLKDACIVTPDPVYMLGMSTWTTGWTSCMRQPNGQFRFGVLSWCYLKGSRIAALLSAKTMVVGGVERRAMRARALVHELRNGSNVYDRIYGNPLDVETLRSSLEAAGYLSVAAARKTYGRIKVVGHAPARTTPYLDSLSSEVTTASAGPWKGTKVRVFHV